MGDLGFPSRIISPATRLDPFNDLVDDLFKGFLVRPVAYEGGRNDVVPRMKVDVAEKNGAYSVTAELPGVKKEDIHVTIDGAQVTLAAEVKREKEVTQDERVLHTERTFGKVSAQLHAAAGGGRGQGRSQVPRRRARADAARRRPRRRASKSRSSKFFCSIGGAP